MLVFTRDAFQQFATFHSFIRWCVINIEYLCVKERDPEYPFLFDTLWSHAHTQKRQIWWGLSTIITSHRHHHYRWNCKSALFSPKSSALQEIKPLHILSQTFRFISKKHKQTKSSKQFKCRPLQHVHYTWLVSLNRRNSVERKTFSS